MSLSTFKQFADLPDEIKVLIWEFVLSPEPSQPLKKQFLLGVRDGRHLGCGLLHHFYVGFIKKAHDMASFDTHYTKRKTLMSTCYLTRQMVLKLWKREISSITWSGNGINESVVAKRLKEKALEGIEDQLKSQHRNYILQWDR